MDRKLSFFRVACYQQIDTSTTIRRIRCQISESESTGLISIPPLPNSDWTDVSDGKDAEQGEDELVHVFYKNKSTSAD
jgi:hypothetical protein